MYLWIVIIGAMFAFFAAMGIGANDAANAYATAVGSKALTIKQAASLAIICETSGAILMGSHVSETIRKGIADYRCFENQPEILMYGCMWVVFSVGLWLFLASYLEMPVSTTHSCVGGMIGMAWALGGSKCVIWYVPLNTFPYIGGVIGIVLSWLFSPILSAIIASTLYYTIRSVVLRHPYESYRIYILYPMLVGSTITLNTFFIIYKGAKGIGLHKTDIGISMAISFGVGGASAIATIPFIPKLRKSINQRYIENYTENNKIVPQAQQAQAQQHQAQQAQAEQHQAQQAQAQQEQQPPDEENIIDITNNIYSETDKRVEDLHNNAEVFDPRTEETFKYLQIFTAMCDSFSHGANDVANAIGPFAAIYTIYQVGDVRKNSVMNENAYWILAIGGVGIALGLLVYGYKIIYAIGVKLCKITPSRGVAIELSSALVIIIGSRLKIPLSTTHCQVGATVGVGALENMKTCSGINCKIFMKTIVGWVVTCVIVGSTTSLFILQGVHSPGIDSRYCPNKTIE